VTDRAAKRRAIAAKLRDDIPRLRKEIEDRRAHISQAIERAMARPGKTGASGFAAWSKHAPALARAIGALARAERRLPGAQERADRTTILENERWNRNERIRAANVGYMKRLDALKEAAPVIHRVWDHEREQEEKRLASMRRALLKRTYKDTNGDPAAAERAEREWWRRPPPMPEPVKQPTDLPEPDAIEFDEMVPPREGLILGTFKVMDPSRIGGILDRPRAPTVWTSRHVGNRLIEAHRILKRLPDRIGPATGGAAWPAFRQEMIEEVTKVGASAFAARANVKIKATAEEIALMNEAIGWPLQFLADFKAGRNYAWLAADVNLWASQTTVEEFEKVKDGAKSVPWDALRLVAAGLNAAKEEVR
jgi:hypothetical protein